MNSSCRHKFTGQSYGMQQAPERAKSRFAAHEFRSAGGFTIRRLP